MALAVHLALAVGWLGAVLAYLALDLTVASRRDAQLVRSAWAAMDVILSSTIIPLAVGTLVSGIVMSLGTKWGLIRHWWVVVSLVLTVVAALVLFAESAVVSRSAAIAATAASDEDVRSLRPTLLHSVGGLVVLLLVQFLNVYKPRGLTPYGWRKHVEERSRTGQGRTALGD